LGTLIGVGRVSSNALARGLCYVYTEVFRNIPILLQLLMWYILMVEWMPDPDAPLQVGNWLLFSKMGLQIAVPTLVDQAPFLALSVPQLVEGEYLGGLTLTPEFFALTLGLTLYTSAFVAEVVRGGIQSVSRGQREAAQSLSLSAWQTTRLVILPQAMRVIVPPLTNQYLNLTKNSSLAVAIGYPDLVNIATTSLNQTGRAVECIAVIMAVYLFLSLLTSFIMNAYNRKVAIKER
jgi:general L-amino acid transport system permease protein